MKHVSVLIPADDCILSSVVGTYKVLTGANRFLQQEGRLPVFDVHLVGQQQEKELYNGLFSIKPSCSIEDVGTTDLVIIPAVMADLTKTKDMNAAFLPWIRDQYARGAEVASLCTGAFLLGATGLLDGKICTTHWRSAQLFRNMFPAADLCANKIITDQNGIYTSGGAYSFLNLLLYLVEKFCGRETALKCSKQFEIEIDRTDQGQFAIFTGQKTHDDSAIRGVQEYIEQHFEEKITVEQLADMSALSHRNFIRRFKKATANTPQEYIQRVKMEAAKKSLEATPHNVNEVMFSVGYNDVKAFRQIFRKYTGMSPMDYKRKFSRSVVS